MDTDKTPTDEMFERLCRTLGYTFEPVTDETRKRLLQVFVDLGVCDNDGNLRPEYRETRLEGDNDGEEERIDTEKPG